MVVPTPMSRETFTGTADDIAEALAPFCTERDWFQYGEKLSKTKLRKNKEMLKAVKRLSDNWNLQKRKVAAAMGKIMAKQRIHWPQDLESKHEALWIKEHTDRLRTMMSHMGKAELAQRAWVARQEQQAFQAHGAMASALRIGRPQL